MNLFKSLVKYEEPDRMVSANRIRRRLKEMGYTSEYRMTDAYHFGPLYAAAQSGRCEVVSVILRILGETDCPNCGKIVSDGNSYCPNCGTKVR